MDDDVSKICMDLFLSSGNIGYYMLYKSLKDKEK